MEKCYLERELDIYFQTIYNMTHIFMGASWLGLFCLQGEAQNFALPAKTRSVGK